MKVLINRQIPVDLWEALIKTNLYASPFQTLDFFSLFNSLPNHSAHVIAVEESDVILALAVVTIQKEKGIKRYFSRRAIIYGGPLIVDDNTEALDLLLSAISNMLINSVIYIETRNFFDFSNFRPLFEKHKWNYQPYLNFHLSCNTHEIAWNQFHNNRKRQIKKALKNGVRIKEADSLYEVNEFYSILKSLYDNKIKKPLFDIGFFKAFFQSNIGKFLLVIYEDKIIGGIMCPILSGKVIYEFYVCGLDKEYKELYPSVMATYAAIEYAYNNGLQYFDFMGAGNPNEDYGVRGFKEKFGGSIVEHGRFINIMNPFLYKLGKISMQLIKYSKK